MKTTPFIAESAAEALAQIRAQLGPKAVVVDVRRLSGTGFSRLWQKPRVQLLAGLPESSEDKPMHALLQKIAELNQQLPPLAEPDRNAMASILGNLSEDRNGMFTAVAELGGEVPPAASEPAASVAPPRGGTGHWP